MVKLPTHLYYPTLRDMTLGTAGYTTPWALAINTEGTCFLRLGSPYSETRQGSMVMRVERYDDYQYYVRLTEYLYTAQDLSNDSDLTPVAGFI